MTIEAVNEKKMVSFRLSITLEADLKIVLAKHGIKGENLYQAFVETVLSFDAKSCPDYTTSAIARMIERARQVRESKRYRQMHDLQSKLKKLQSYQKPVIPVTQQTDLNETTDEPIVPQFDTAEELGKIIKQPLTQKKHENNRKSNRSRPRGKALRRS